jgi:hypothetical protein
MQHRTDCEEISYTLTSGLMLPMEKYVPGKSNWVLTDTISTKEVEYIKEKVLRIQRPETYQKTELICMSLRRLWIYSSLRVLLTIQKICLFARSSKKEYLIISKAGGKHCRFSLHKTTP